MQSETVPNTSGLAKQVAPTQATNHDRPSVLLVGASVRWAAQSAAAGGYRVIAMDSFGDLDTRAASARCEMISPLDQLDPAKLHETIAAIAHEERAAVVWVGGLRSASVIHGGEAPPGLSHDSLMELARNAGFYSPETTSVSDRRVSTSARWLVKERNSTGGLGVRFHDPCRDRPLPTDAILQRWIPGCALGLVAIADTRRVTLLGMTRSIYHRLGDLPFVYAGSRTLARGDSIPCSSMQALCERIADARGLRGLFNLDWIRDRQNRWWLLEVNERPSASCEVIERSLRARGIRPEEASLMRSHLAARVPARVSSERVRPNAAHSENRLSTLSEVRCAALDYRDGSSIHIKRIVYSRSEGRVVLSELARRWRTRAGASAAAGASPGWQLADIPADGTPVQRGQPIATLLLDSVPGAAPPSRMLQRAIRQVQSVVREA